MRIKKYILMKNLIHMQDYVIDRRMFITNNDITESDLLAQIFLYAKFLKQPLELWMFIPCDEEGNVMKEPYMVFADDNEECEDYIKLFCEAKEKCLFEIYSFEDDIENYWYFGIDEFKLIGVEKSENVESLCNYGLSLTPTALKQLCLNH